MTKLKKIGYSLNDVAIIPSSYSEQNHRGDVDPYVDICGRKSFPIFVAPMASVTDENNYQTWIDNKVTPVIPRSVQMRLTIKQRLELAQKTFVSFSLKETQTIFALTDREKVKNYFNENSKIYICIDIAHGALSNLYDICKKIKEEYRSNIIIMTGNIANPEAYYKYCECGIDYMRASIGNGSRCTTSCAVGVHFPLASLLDELNEARDIVKAEIGQSVEGKFYYKLNLLYQKVNLTKCFTFTKIIADGGIGWYDDINKSLALGADAVMIGRLFAECEEACGEKEETFDKNGNLRWKRMYSGMSHRSMQKITGGDGSKVSEGICQYVDVKYPVKQFITNMESYLRSCMTYTNSQNIEDLKNSNLIILGGGQTFKK